MKKIALIIESASDGEIWGRVHYDDDLIVDSAGDVEELKNKMTAQLMEFHDLKKDRSILTFSMTFQAYSTTRTT